MQNNLKNSCKWNAATNKKKKSFLMTKRKNLKNVLCIRALSCKF